MKEIEKILRYVQKTNPGITEKKLLEELKKSRYSTAALVVTCQNRNELQRLPI